MRKVWLESDQSEPVLADIAASFQEAVVDVLVHKLLHAAAVHKCPRVVLAGGVAANGGLRARLAAEAAAAGIAAHIPPLSFCGDNAAMIAAAGYHHLQAGCRGALTDDVYSRNTRPLSVAGPTGCR